MTVQQISHRFAASTTVQQVLLVQPGILHLPEPQGALHAFPHI